MNFNRVTKQIIVFVAGFIMFFCLLGIAGTTDRTEQIVYAMPQEAYEAIYLKLGNGCTDRHVPVSFFRLGVCRELPLSIGIRKAQIQIALILCNLIQFQRQATEHIYIHMIHDRQ